MSSISVPLPSPSELPDMLRQSSHWIVWKAEPREDKVAKIPCDTNGFTASMKQGHQDLTSALQVAELLRTEFDCEMFGVGLAFSDDMEFVGVDLDAAIVDGVRAPHLDWAINTYPTWGEVSLSGVGVHLFYAGKFAGKRNALIDDSRFEIFGTKGFIAITGRSIADVPFELAPFDGIHKALAPHLEVKKIATGGFVPRNGYSDPNSAYGQAALRAQCDRVRGAVTGTLHYTLCSAATSLGRLIPNYLSFEAAEAALYEAAEAAGGKDMNLALKTIQGQLEFGAIDPASPKDRMAEDSGIDLSEFTVAGGDEEEEEEIEEEKSPTHKDPGEFPQYLLNVPGFISDVVAYTNRNSFVLQPVLSLAGALALLAVLTGRKISDADGVRTNCYILAVAGSGEGKDAARKSNKKILFAAGASELVGAESWASGPGLLAAVDKTPAILFQNDEIGRFFQTTSDPRKSPHLFSINSILLKLYSSANDVFLGDAYADVKKQTTIVNPHAVVYGTTVPTSLYEAMTEESITGGLMGRMFIFEADSRKKGIAQDPDTTELPHKIVDLARQWFSWRPSKGNLTWSNPDPFIVPIDHEAVEILRELRKFSRDQCAIYGDTLGSLWVRCTENAKKLALLYACSENFGTQARIGVDAAKWACELTKYLVSRQCWVASQFVSSNHIESISMKVERLIRAAGTDGLDATELLRKTRGLGRKERDDCVSYLMESKLISKSIIKTPKGRPRSVYVAH